MEDTSIPEDRHQMVNEVDDLARARDKAESVVDATALPPVTATLDAVGIPTLPRHESLPVPGIASCDFNEEDHRTFDQHDQDILPHSSEYLDEGDLIETEDVHGHDRMKEPPLYEHSALPSPHSDIATPRSDHALPDHQATLASERSEEEAKTVAHPAKMDVLWGRGAAVNAHEGNKKFRALCFLRKMDFENGSIPARKRIATEVVEVFLQTYESRFLRKGGKDEPWFLMTKHEAIKKAAQVIRDYKRPDRIDLHSVTGKRRRATATPMDNLPSTFFWPTNDAPVSEQQVLSDNPVGVHDHDILSGRGAFVNAHAGNVRLRQLAQQRKDQFNGATCFEKKALATEIVTIIRSLEPPGRFLKRVDKKNGTVSVDKAPTETTFEWEEMSDERAIHKACQVMRDLGRPDRRERDEKRKLHKQRLLYSEEAVAAAAEVMDAMERQQLEHQASSILQASVDCTSSEPRAQDEGGGGLSPME